MKFIKILTFSILLIITLLFKGCTLFNSPNSNYTNNLIIHYIDVGQGDCILIQTDLKNLLIDSGSSDSKEKVVNYLDSLNIRSLDYVIATHPHEDHIGNMDTLIKKYSVKHFYSPKVITSSIDFENMVTALIDKNLKINVIKTGIKSINLGEKICIDVFSPSEDFLSENLNEYSPIIKLTFIDTSFIFTGDAEESNEISLTSKNYDLKCNVLKIGHHGSSTSSSEEFLKACNPDAAIISVGKNNSYGHPSKEVLNRLKKLDIEIYRTDLMGSIVLISDGYSIKKLK